MVYIEALEPPGRPASELSIGQRAPAHCTSAGKALLALKDLDELAHTLPSPLPVAAGRTSKPVEALIDELREVCQTGYAREVDEHRRGFASIGAAIVVNGVSVGAISIGHPSSSPLDPKVSLALREAISALSRNLRTGLTPDRVRWILALLSRPRGATARGRRRRAPSDVRSRRTGFQRLVQPVV